MQRLFPLFLLLMLAPVVSAGGDGEQPKDPDWLLYRSHGRVRLLTADLRRDVWENRWRGDNTSVQLSINDTPRYLRIDAAEFVGGGTRHLRLFQRPDGTVLCKDWNDLIECSVGTVEFASFDAALADPDVSRVLGPILKDFGQSIPDAGELRTCLSGGRCDEKQREKVRAELPGLASPDRKLRKVARLRLEPYRAVLWDGVRGLDLTPGQRAQLAAIAYMPPIRATPELWEVVESCFTEGN